VPSCTMCSCRTAKEVCGDTTSNTASAAPHAPRHGAADSRARHMHSFGQGHAAGAGTLARRALYIGNLGRPRKLHQLLSKLPARGCNIPKIFIIFKRAKYDLIMCF
jgi:hypothetical protein